MEPAAKKAKHTVEPAKCPEFTMELLNLAADGNIRKPLELQRVQGVAQKHLAMALSGIKVYKYISIPV